MVRVRDARRRAACSPAWRRSRCSRAATPRALVRARLRDRPSPAVPLPRQGQPGDDRSRPRGGRPARGSAQRLPGVDHVARRPPLLPGRLPEPAARVHPLGVQLRDTRSRRAHHQLRGATSGSSTRWPARRPARLWILSVPSTASTRSVKPTSPGPCAGPASGNHRPGSARPLGASPPRPRCSAETLGSNLRATALARTPQLDRRLAVLAEDNERRWSSRAALLCVVPRLIDVRRDPSASCSRTSDERRAADDYVVGSRANAGG